MKKVTVSKKMDFGNRIDRLEEIQKQEKSILRERERERERERF
jgi:hypothetical protein